MKNLESKINDSIPVAWSIAGSDSGGGAGIQADLKTMTAMGVHGCTAITVLTAQNTRGVVAMEAVSEMVLRAQLDALASDLPPAAIKSGMLGSAATCRILASFFQETDAPVVCDPVLKSTSGTALLDQDALDVLIDGIFPHVEILTPNLPEAQQLAGAGATNVEEVAERILKLGVRSVLVKGGHAELDECRDYWTDGTKSFWLSSPRIQTTSLHGTGCILSSAIASAIALGQDVPTAVVTAKTFLNQCLKSPANAGSGNGPMRVEAFMARAEDRPTVTD